MSMLENQYVVLVRPRLPTDPKVFNGLDVSGSPILDELTTLSEVEHVRALQRIDGMNHIQRSGDLILIMKDATFGSVSNRYTTAYACKSWHGSLNPSDSYVPFIVAYPGGNKNAIDNAVNTVCSNNKCNGNWKLPELVKQIIETQYSGH